MSGVVTVLLQGLVVDDRVLDQKRTRQVLLHGLVVDDHVLEQNVLSGGGRADEGEAG